MPKKNRVDTAKIVAVYDDMKAWEEAGIVFFELCGQTTADMMEAVAIMHKNFPKKHPIWTCPKFGTYETSEKCLYWLSGGDGEWIGSDTFIGDWSDYSQPLTKKLGKVVEYCERNGDTFGEISCLLSKHLDFSTVYDWCIRLGAVRLPVFPAIYTGEGKRKHDEDSLLY